MGELYMVATPIGNMEDITYRAVRILGEVDVIACEDTRQTIKLLNHYGIKKPLLSCRAANEKQSAPGLVKMMLEGKTMAYVSDAGTPGLSDPGKILVREARDRGIPVIPVPGASAFASLVSICGFPGKAVTFEGFLSPKKGKRKKRLSELLQREDAFVLYESPFRIVKLLEDLAELSPEANVLLGREITKKFEEICEDSAADLFAEWEKRTTIKGEIALLVSPGAGKND
ncbi:MAG: 16S rRNA (cytidine(1402)-2'-O)-methyltransferase [Spirochaetales bacterium]|nr:16S rRNA (cytidine(1402)-2'-O)-methyltransferase [Spirochaetales bacterium]